jgi:hypothetical protein
VTNDGVRIWNSIYYTLLATTSNSSSPWDLTVYGSQWHGQSLLSLLSLHQSSGIWFQRQTFPFLWFPNCIRASATVILSSQQLRPHSWLNSALHSRNWTGVNSNDQIGKMLSNQIFINPWVGTTREHHSLFFYCCNVDLLLSNGHRIVSCLVVVA